jgi:hypothetical protein
MARSANPLIAPLLRFASRLRFPWLVAITATLFVLDVAIPDLVPFADEALLGLLTIALASFKRRQRGEPRAVPPVGDDPSGSGSA